MKTTAGLLLMIVLGLLRASARDTAAEGEWEALPALPRGVAGHAMAVDADGGLWVAGGSFWSDGARRVSGEVWHLAPGAGAWEKRAEIPGGWAYGGAATDASRQGLYLAGGLGSRGAGDTLWRVDLKTGTVSAAGRLPGARSHCGAAWLDGALWVAGGTASGAGIEKSDAHLLRVEFDPVGGARVVPMPPVPGEGLVNPLLLPLGGRLHVLPGSAWSPTEKRLRGFEEIPVFDPDSGRWERHPAGRALPRGMNGVALTDTLALVAGGVAPGDGRGAATISAGVWFHDAQRRVFYPGPPLPRPRLATAMAVVSMKDGACRVFLSGGEDRPQGRATEVWMLEVRDVEGARSPIR